MNLDPTGTKRALPLSGVLYGYWVVLAGFLLCVVNGGLYFYGFGAFLKIIAEELGTRRTVLAGAFSLARLEGA